MREAVKNSPNGFLFGFQLKLFTFWPLTLKKIVRATHYGHFQFDKNLVTPLKSPWLHDIISY